MIINSLFAGFLAVKSNVVEVSSMSHVYIVIETFFVSFKKELVN